MLRKLVLFTVVTDFGLILVFSECINCPKLELAAGYIFYVSFIFIEESSSHIIWRVLILEIFYATKCLKLFF